jgi:hypothetical protein
VSEAHAGGGGAAPRPTPVAGGPVPVPDDLLDLLPEGFVLPENVQLVFVPPVTPEAQVAGAVEHASMMRGLADAAAADAAKSRAANAAAEAEQDAAIARMAADADAAEQRARDVAARHDLEIGGEIPRHPTFAFLDEQEG